MTHPQSVNGDLKVMVWDEAPDEVNRPGAKLGCDLSVIFAY